MTNVETATQLSSASKAFDALFDNDVRRAKETFKTDDSPFHLLGLGVVSFLEAALGMEVVISTIHPLYIDHQFSYIDWSYDRGKSSPRSI